MHPLFRGLGFESLPTVRCASFGLTGGSTTRTRNRFSTLSSNSKTRTISTSGFRFSARASKTSRRFSRRLKLGSGPRSFTSVGWKAEPIILRCSVRQTSSFRQPTTNFSASLFSRRLLRAAFRSYPTGKTLDLTFHLIHRGSVVNMGPSGPDDSILGCSCVTGRYGAVEIR